MNIGNKIKSLREEKKLSTEELADLVNDTVENIIKYENNELEPTLDKKLSLANILGTSLDELMYRNAHSKKDIVDQSVMSRYDDDDIQDNIIYNEKNASDESTKEVVEEILGQSNIEFTEKVFESIFVGRRGKMFLFNLLWSIIYIISVILFMYIGENFLAIIMGVFGVFTFIPSVLKYLAYKKAKKGWLNMYGEKKRNYLFYQNYLVVQDSNEVLNTLFYKNFQTIAEQGNYLVGMIVQDENQGLVIVVDKNGFGEGEYPKVKEAIKGKCKNFVEEKTYPNLVKQTTSNNNTSKQTTYNRRLNAVSWLFVLLSVLSISITKFFSNTITGGDQTLKANLIVYSISLILPILSIVLGFISEIKYKQKSRKNIWFGLIMITFCIIQIISSISYHIIYIDKNNLEAYNQLETIFEIDLPDNYYTIYNNEKEYELTIEDIDYYQTDYQVLCFLKTSEIKKLNEVVKNDWTITDQQKIYYNTNSEIQSELKKARIDLNSYKSYYTFKESSDGKIIYLFYFEDLASLVTVTYTK